MISRECERNNEKLSDLDDEDSEEEKAQIRRHLQSDSETLQDEIKAVLRDKSLLRKSLSDDEVSSQEFLDEIADLKLQDDYADHIESDNELERKKKELRKLKKMKALRQSMLKKFKPFPINKFNKFSDSNSDELDEENNIIDVFCRGLKKRAKNSLTIAKLRVELCR